ncbi:putative transporter SVOPL isoform X2 [Paramacrobiotus metropolitanus]|uniref:putative transporter SVOPL isoform X2 n=1 Tax=Paramacrobiotus metropolitanus TaxID=2943436 RepID=UPI0024459681|nr:putative transporter SVOPL isoform X2 [Paramacrobiotus metropolitanus]
MGRGHCLHGSLCRDAGVQSALGQNVRQFRTLADALRRYVPAGMVWPTDLFQSHVFLASVSPDDCRGSGQWHGTKFYFVCRNATTETSWKDARTDAVVLGDGKLYSHRRCGHHYSLAGMAISHRFHGHLVLAQSLLFPVPESPRFLLGKGRLLEATTLLARIAKVNKTQLPKGHLIVPPTQMQGKISDMLSKNYRRLTLQLWVVWFCMTFGYYGVVLSSTEIVERARICDLSGQIVNQGEAVAVEDCGCRPLSGDDYMTLIVGTLGEFGSLFINAALMDLIGRKLTFVVNLLCCAFFVLMLNICTSRFVLSMFILCARMFMSAIGNCVYVYTSEVYPTTFRAVGLGVCSSVARIGSMISPFIAQVLLARSLPAGLGVYAVIMLITALNCLLLPIETKGKNLEETAVLH